MRFKMGLSIRYKILILLTLVPLISLSLFLLLAIRVFENDKVAYIFENSALISKTLSAQVRTELNTKLLSAKPLMQEFLERKQFGSLSQALIEDENFFQWVAAIRFQSGKLFQLGLIEKKKMSSTKFSNISQIGNYIKEASSLKRLVRFPSNNDEAILIEKAQSLEGDIYFVMLARMTDVAKAFRTTGSAQNYLVSSQGGVVLGPEDSTITNLTQKLDSRFFERLSDQKLNIGTEEVKTAKGEAWLVGYAKVSYGGMLAMSLVPKRDALRAIQELIRKSLILFLIIITMTTTLSLVASGQLTSSLTLLLEATRKIAEGKFDMKVNVSSKDEVGSLANSFNAMSDEVSRLMLQTAEKARMETELKTAQTVQETLFPKPQARVNGLNIYGHYEPASECGGDWWHYSQVGRKVYLWIGDATGHGAPAALITSAARSAATIIENLSLDPSLAMNLLNQAIFDVSKGKIMMTFFLACFDPESKTLTYANASHEAPLLMRKQVELIEKKHLIPLNEITNPRLGESRETKYKQATIKLGLGDRIFFYTDGLAEIQNENKSAFGERALIKALLSSNQAYPPIEQCMKSLITTLSEFRKKSPLADDVTFFLTEMDVPKEVST